MDKAPKNKPMDDADALYFFNESSKYKKYSSYEEFMESKGYRWSRSENMWVDDGSLAVDYGDWLYECEKDRRMLKGE